MLSSGCPGGWFKLGDKCYGMADKSSDPVQNAYYARKVCQDLGGDLPSIVEENQNLFMSIIMKDEVCTQLLFLLKHE